MSMNCPHDFRVSQSVLIAGFLRGGLTMTHACEIVHVTPWQGRYMLVKNGCKPSDIKASPDYAKNTFSKGALIAAIELMFMGAAPEDIFFVTGITMNRILSQMNSIH